MEETHLPMTADPVWTPSESDIARARITDFARWAGEKHGRSFDGYDDLWHWSISDLEGFWSSIAEYFDVRFGSPPDRILADASMPGAEWFTGATLNYAEHALRRRGSEAAILSRSQTTGADLSLSRDELAEAVGRSEEHTSELQSRENLVCRPLLERNNDA